MKFSPQQKAILEILLTKAHITSGEYAAATWSTKLTSRISELRALGYDIKDVPESAGKKHWKRYFMLEKEIERIKDEIQLPMRKSEKKFIEFQLSIF